jgi:UDP-N-acetylglucosamine--N-acetylmuramyl-(pentapeptide) pyrophosphoryl-undecaprenol N-acetylglucosamine transferase
VVTVVIAGGGTGGHVFPMIAVGDALKAVDPTARVVYVGTARGIEARVMPPRGDSLELLDIRPLRGSGLKGFMKGAYFAAASIPSARRLIAKLGANAVLSVGGYAGGPVALAARTLGIPVALLEPNSVLGLSNRLLTPIVARAYTAFPEVESALRPSVIRRAGVPLRGAFSRKPYAPSDDNNAKVRILLLGGSQGAKALNETVPHALRSLIKAGDGNSIELVHQTGRDREIDVRALYTQLGLLDRVTVTPFIDDMASALASADIVIGRSGASSLAELCVIGRASILIPYPFAADDHQLKNARSLERAGAAVAIPQSEATAARVACEIDRLVKSPELRARMAEAAASLGKADAARDVAEDLLHLARASSSEQPNAPIEPNAKESR